MTILLVGGGTGGSVSPLLALAKQIRSKHPRTSFMFLGQRGGVEERMATSAAIPFTHISGGKLRRYFSLANIATPFKVVYAFFVARRILQKTKACCVVGTGSFLQVPVMWAAWTMGIPVVLHQQDVRPTLSNKLCAPIAKKITVTFEQSLKDFPQGFGVSRVHGSPKVVWTGNPSNVEPSTVTREAAVQYFSLDVAFPTILVVGGGTGSRALNTLVLESREILERIANVIHITGPGKGDATHSEHYYATEFLDNMEYAYTAADIVVCRAGLSTITELSVFKKASIIIPLPNSHQEENANLLANLGAAIVLPEQIVSKENFFSGLRKVLFNSNGLQEIAAHMYTIMPHNAGEEMARVVMEIAGKHD